MSWEASTAVIDRWIEPAAEPEPDPECLTCGHGAEWHDDWGCWHEFDDDDGGVWCSCEEFK